MLHDPLSSFQSQVAIFLVFSKSSKTNYNYCVLFFELPMYWSQLLSSAEGQTISPSPQFSIFLIIRGYRSPEPPEYHILRPTHFFKGFLCKFVSPVVPHSLQGGAQLVPHLAENVFFRRTDGSSLPRIDALSFG